MIVLWNRMSSTPNALVAQYLLLVWLIILCWKPSSKSEAQKMYTILHNYTFGNYLFCLMQVECCCFRCMNYSNFVTGGQTIDVGGGGGTTTQKTVHHVQKHIQCNKIILLISSISIQSKATPEKRKKQCHLNKTHSC